MSYTKEEIRDHRTQWVAALRSGKYQQIQKALHTLDGYCCLGVACDINIREDKETKAEWLVSSNLDNWLSYVWTINPDKTRCENSILPQPVARWLGLPDNPYVFTENGQELLTNLNDEGVSFPRIADLIEATYITGLEDRAKRLIMYGCDIGPNFSDVSY